MLAKRIIPCLDIKDSRTVKGVNFIDIKDAGDPVELAVKYSENGADELVFLDITATKEDRRVFAKLVYEIASKINIPFTVGGGIKSIDDVGVLLDNGADKVSVNSYAFKRPYFIDDIASKFGSQAVVVAVDAKQIKNNWYVHLIGGSIQTEIILFDWAKELQERGAGEILFTSMDHDGTKNGFANNTLKWLSESLNIPVIASGGAGKIEHFTSVFEEGKADAALAASVFHFNEIEIKDLKIELFKNKIPIRL
ncbi:MAG: imidazole glycerol phosphate synthase subunit HisF [Flavobacteriales bacterium]|jgi:cyclase|tara:strand:- start:1483 stop:2238 length:756 start_codon:yes stop_codon:yes gene_type:complete